LHVVNGYVSVEKATQRDSVQTVNVQVHARQRVIRDCTHILMTTTHRKPFFSALLRADNRMFREGTAEFSSPGAGLARGECAS
jgi:hypothetical protein